MIRQTPWTFQCFGLLLALVGMIGMHDRAAAEEPPMSLPTVTEILTRCVPHDAVIQTPYGAFRTAPALADLDGDGQLEIVAAVNGGMIGAWHADGRLAARMRQSPEQFAGGRGCRWQLR